MALYGVNYPVNVDKAVYKEYHYKAKGQPFMYGKPGDSWVGGYKVDHQSDDVDYQIMGRFHWTENFLTNNTNPSTITTGVTIQRFIDISWGMLELEPIFSQP